MTVQRRIVLTGASRGLGLALAHRFTALGHSVRGCSRSGLVSRQDGFVVDSVDVRDPNQVLRWAEDLTEAGHVPDLLVTNAALINEPARLWEMASKDIEAIISTNVLGTIYTLQAFLPAMLKRGSGMVVLLSSGWGRATDPGFAPYCSSKFAVEGLMQSLAQELPSGLAVASLSPGVVQTDMLVRCWGERAFEYELPDPWAERAAPLILDISVDENGNELTVPPPPPLKTR